MINIGILALQGAVTEHLEIVERALSELGIKGRAVAVRNRDELSGVEALIIPGGESTAISKLLFEYDIAEKIQSSKIPIMGTCAGCVLVAKKVAGRNAPKTLSMMNIEVKRNAFGRQRESFVCDIALKGFDKPYRAVFIRAPAIVKTWGSCKVLARYKNNTSESPSATPRILTRYYGMQSIPYVARKLQSNFRRIAREYIVAAQQNNLIALSFHPELTNDTRVHKYFLEMAK